MDEQLCYGFLVLAVSAVLAVLWFLWGFIKSKVYATKPADIPELKDRIWAAFAQITVKMRQKSMLSYHERLEQVIENYGGHVEVHN